MVKLTTRDSNPGNQRRQHWVYHLADTAKRLPLLMVANKISTIMERVCNHFRCNSTNLDPKWVLPEFTVTKISKANTHWSRECIRATYNANKLCREHITAQIVNMIDKIVPEEFQQLLAKIERKEEVKRKHRTIQARLKKPCAQLTYIVQTDRTKQ